MSLLVLGHLSAPHQRSCMTIPSPQGTSCKKGTFFHPFTFVCSGGSFLSHRVPLSHLSCPLSSPSPGRRDSDRRCVKTENFDVNPKCSSFSLLIMLVFHVSPFLRFDFMFVFVYWFGVKSTHCWCDPVPPHTHSRTVSPKIWAIDLVCGSR